MDCILLVFLSTIGVAFADYPPQGCDSNPTDIVFVLDESGSIWGPHFKQLLDSVQAIIASFDVGFNQTHVGVMTFGTNNRVIFPLGKYTSESKLKAAVANIRQQRGETYTHLALKRLRGEMFSPQYARSWARHVAIVITDGESNFPQETKKEAALCHKAGLEVLAVGVGQSVVRNELEAIASSPYKVFTVDSYGALHSLGQILARKACAEKVSITPPNLVTKNPGENCKLQWMVSGTFSNYTIVSLKSGNPNNLGPNTNTDYDSVKGILTLYIWNVQAQDAGYYVLTLSTRSKAWLSSNGVLFVYGNVSININSSSGKKQFTEGDVIEIKCNAASYFTPPGFQTKIHYFWRGDNGYLRNTSSGPAITVDGDVVAGHSLKNNGQILSIDTTQIEHLSTFYSCQAQEEGSFYKSSLYYWNYTLSHRPFFSNVIPRSKKWNWPSSFGSTSFQFYCSSVPPLSSYSNWSFVDASGNQQYLPLSTNLSVTPWTSIEVPLSGQDVSSGNFTVTISNGYGSNNITFQLIPPGVPDTPGDFEVQYVTHSVVSLQWRCGWHNGEPQTVTVTLTSIANNTVVETLKTLLVSDAFCYNSLFSSTFQSIVMPATEYMASIWSSNVYGRSIVATLRVQTPFKPTFSVLCEDISFTESTAIVSVTTSVVGVWLNVSCCVETRAQCVKQSKTLLTLHSQIVIDSIPTGDAYVFDFLLFDRGFDYTYSLALIKGLKKSRNANGDTVIPCNAGVFNASRQQSSFGNTTENADRYPLIAVIVLASLLGVAVLVIIVSLILISRLIRSNPTNENEYEQEMTLPSSANNPTMETDSNYEGIIGDYGNRSYTPLEGNPPPIPPQIRMQQLPSRPNVQSQRNYEEITYDNKVKI